MSMGDPPASSALTESLQLLAEDNTDFFDEFTIDSDDEEIFPSNSKEGQKIVEGDTDTDTDTAPTILGETPPTNLEARKQTDKTSSPLTTTPLSGSGSGSVSTLKKETVSATEDPLSGTSSWRPAGAGPQPQADVANAHSQAPPSSAIPNANVNLSHVGSANSVVPPIVTEHVTTSSSFVSSKTAQSLSSTFSSFASKFQDAVSSVSVGAVTSSSSNNHTTSNAITGGSRMVLPQQQQSLSNVSMNTNYVNRSASAGAGLGISHVNNGAVHAHGRAHGTPTSVNAQGGIPQSSSKVIGGGNGSGGATVYNSSAISAATMSPDLKQLDNAKKSILIKSAIGKLLQGEEVIMFLSNLQNVSETSSPHTGIGSSLFQNKGNNRDLIWCCAMTFYRIVVFSYHESEFVHLTSGANGNGIGNSSSSTNANANAASSTLMTEQEDIIEQWIKSASVSRKFQYYHTSHQIRTNGKRHFVMQMPLASIDRVEKSTEFASSNSGTTASSIIGGTMGVVNMNMSGMGSYGDSLGGASVASGTLVIHGKDNGRFIKFTTPSYADCMRAYEALDTYAFPGKRNLGYLFAFESRRVEVQASVKNISEGAGQGGGGGGSTVGAGLGQSKMGRITCVPTPRRYDALTEFTRMVRTCNTEGGGGANSDHLQIQCPWRPLTKANHTYNTCQSYPSIVFGPSFVNDDTPEGLRVIRQIAAFRSGNRFQTMSWASRYDGASIWRCAQPKVGLQGNRSTADEMYIKKIGECAALANTQAVLDGKMPKRPSTAFLRMLTGGINESDMMLDTSCRENAAFSEKCMVKILDLRPKSSAMANRTAGYGYENTSYYKNTTLSFHGIGNIHVVRDSYQKLSALCANPSANDLQWHQLVEDTKWLSQLRAILSVSWQTAFHVRYNRLPVLVHCSHGWDRTSQVSALAQIFLDPFFRTRAGFSCLVEKEFLALGHPFHLRCGHGEGRGDRNNGSGGSAGQVDEAQMSPIFIQFLDCVFQIVHQYPDYFEFNTQYLLLISEHVYSCRFGTLLCDTEREREAVASIRQRTHCLWEYLDTFPQVLNKNYVEVSLKPDEFEGNGAMLMPLPNLLRNVTLWVDRFCMHGAKPMSRCLKHGYNPIKVMSEEEQLIFNGHGNFLDKVVSSAQEQATKWKKVAEEKDKEILKLKRQLSLLQETKED